MTSNLPDIEYWRGVIEAADLGVWDYDLEKAEKSYSAKWREIRGLRLDEAVTATDQEWLAMLHPDDVVTAAYYTDLINAGTAKTVAFEYREKNATGGWTWFMCRGRAVHFDQFGRATRFVGIDTDITAMKSIEAERIVAARQLENAVALAEIGIWRYDVISQSISWDRRMCKIYGIPDALAPLPRDIWEHFLHPDEAARVLAETEAGLLQKQQYGLNYRIVRNDGEVRHIRSHVSYLSDGIDGPSFIGVNWDVTQDIRRAEELEAVNRVAEERLAQFLVAQRELEHLTRHDPLTEVMNRRAFDSQVAALSPDGRPSFGLGVMVIDVDNLKVVNDRWGHEAGDVILKWVAQVLKSELGQLGIVARTGGDEFVALLPNAGSENELGQKAEAVAARVCARRHEGGPLPSVSIGVSNSLLIPQTIPALLRSADQALYRAKDAGRSRVVFA